MSSESYDKGRNFENYIKRKLQSKGFFVIRSSGSKGVFDLIAFPPKYHDRCPDCGSNNIQEVQEKWGICLDCQSNFYMVPLSISNGKIMGIQCKAYGCLSQSQKQSILEVANKYGLMPVLATKFNKRVIFVNLENGAILGGI